MGSTCASSAENCWSQVSSCTGRSIDKSRSILSDVVNRNDKRGTYFLFAHNSQVQLTLIVLQNYQGLDIYCLHKNSAGHIVDFIASKIPVRVKSSKKQVSKQLTEYVALVECASVVKGDLVQVTSKVGGRITDLMLVVKMSSNIHLISPITMKRLELNSQKYFLNPVETIMTQTDLVKFVVLIVEPVYERPNTGGKPTEAMISSKSSIISGEGCSNNFLLVDAEVELYL